MTLTLFDGPLTTDPPVPTNYSVEGPAHRILFATFPRRVRAVVGGEVLLDTTRGRLLHESNILPVLYVPDEDIRDDLLVPSDHSTHCPFKGDASYWSIVIGDRTVEDAVWGYPQPNEDATWLAGYKSVYWDRADAWFDEDEYVEGRLRDPYHRVDARRTSRRVVVRAGDTVLADSSRAVVVSETGLPNRWYLPPEDIRADLLTTSTTRTHCPYKGWATYWSLRADADVVLPDGGTDIAWGYEDPFSDALPAAGHRCLHAEGLVTQVDGDAVD